MKTEAFCLHNSCLLVFHKTSILDSIVIIFISRNFLRRLHKTAQHKTTLQPVFVFHEAPFSTRILIKKIPNWINEGLLHLILGPHLL